MVDVDPLQCGAFCLLACAMAGCIQSDGGMVNAEIDLSPTLPLRR